MITIILKYFVSHIGYLRFISNSWNPPQIIYVVVQYDHFWLKLSFIYPEAENKQAKIYK